MFLILSILLIAILAMNSSALISIDPPYAGMNHEKGVFLVEFQPGYVNSKESILNHLESKSYDRNKILFRTSTETDLFTGHSFFIDQDHEEAHIASIPGAIKIYRVKTVPRPRPVTRKFPSETSV